MSFVADIVVAVSTVGLLIYSAWMVKQLFSQTKTIKQLLTCTKSENSSLCWSFYLQVTGISAYKPSQTRHTRFDQLRLAIVDP